jgi:hypothetical protein
LQAPPAPLQSFHPVVIEPLRTGVDQLQNRLPNP